MKRWEYLVAEMDERYVLFREVTPHLDRTWVTLKQLGYDGWELCSVLPSYIGEFGTELSRAIFKRQEKLDSSGKAPQ